MIVVCQIGAKNIRRARALNDSATFIKVLQNFQICHFIVTYIWLQ